MRQFPRPSAGRCASPIPGVQRKHEPSRTGTRPPAVTPPATPDPAPPLPTTVAEERALLGWPPSSTFHKYKSGDVGPLSFDTLTRISLVLGVYKSLQILYPEQAFADRWIRMPNVNPLFAGRAPIAFLADAGIDGLFQLRRLLDSRRG